MSLSLKQKKKIILMEHTQIKMCMDRKKSKWENKKVRMNI